MKVLGLASSPFFLVEWITMLKFRQNLEQIALHSYIHAGIELDSQEKLISQH